DGQQLDHGALIDCILAAGVSTAETVSDISGRGVGMDVVKRAIQQAGGKITIDTTAGKGSLFRIALPKSVTTQIGMGYFVRSGGELFILDLEAVQETFHQVKAPQHTPEQVSFIQRRGRTLPVINLSHQLGLRTSQTAAIAIATEVNNRDCALLVEEVVGIKQMVKLPLDLPGQHHLPYQGVAMQGNGQLALILDLARLCQAAHQDH
ncbi:MAG: chemotaxis protein CheA, partial [Planctomycetota bacterium]